MRKRVNISVHQLVDFLLRKGDIDDRVFNNETMQEGSALHAKYQASKTNFYRSEVDLSHEFIIDEYDVKLHGRADGVSLEEIPVIEEIKTTNSDLEEFNEKHQEWHLGQAECYAYLYCLQNDIDKIGIRLVYIRQNNTKKTLFKYFLYKFDELKYKVDNYLHDYLNFTKTLEENKEKRNKSIKKLEFPFDFREGQEELINFSKATLESNMSTFIEASTGIGKTLAINYGVLKGSLRTKTDKFVFLCAKNSGFRSASNCLDILRNNGLFLSSVEIISKEKMCVNKNHNCNPEDCPFAKNYYDKVHNILKNLFRDEYEFSSEKIKKMALENEICPFEFSLDISNYVDYLIMDYNYVFNPISYLKRLFDTQDYDFKTFLMIDEAHNMIDRSREMYTTSISYKEFLKAKESFTKIKSKPIKDIIEILDDDFNLFNNFEMEEENLALETLDEDFLTHILKYENVYKQYLINHPKYKNTECKEFNLEIHKFLKINDFYNENFKYYIKKHDDNFEIYIKCLDASSFIRNRLNECSGAIFFSGTLSPIDYFEQSIIGDNVYQHLHVNSNYSDENLKILINNRISTKYKDRDTTMDEVIDYINTFISNKLGNYLIYLPSFQYLNKLKEKYHNDDINLLFQEEEMDNLAKQEFINSFKPNPSITTVGFCVIGGSFSEGIDLVDDRLIGILIVGVGLPSISFENNLIKDYYDSIGLDGFIYAYVNPGINKIMQAVGRLIRSENDRGIATLIDSRYLNKTYKVLFDEWKNNKLIKNKQDFIKELNSFYKSK